MHGKAVATNITVKPLSPMVIDFVLGAWLMRILSQGHGAKNHNPAICDLIEINWGIVQADRDAGATCNL